MDRSVGTALRDTRLQKNLTVEEVARLTKIRPDRITDLENDDYTRFPNLAYARSFLVLYAKFLGVDISKFPTVEVGSAVGVGDYQYLQREEAQKPHRARPVPTGPPKKPRWLILFFVFLVMLILGALVGWGIMTVLRVLPPEPKKVAQSVPVPASTPLPTPTPTPAPTPEATPTPAPVAAETPAVPVLPAIPLETASSGTPAEVRHALPLTPEASDAALLGQPEPPPTPTPEATFPAKGEVREIKVSVTKRTKVRIVKDHPNDSSLYNGSMNPAMKPMSFKGRYFWIKTADPEAVQVTIDGKPASGPDAGVEIR